MNAEAYPVCLRVLLISEMSDHIVNLHEKG